MVASITNTNHRKRSPPMLSRVADSLYWMSRYLERAEHTARLLDVNLNQMLDQTPESADQRWDRLLASMRVSLPEGVSDPNSITQALTFDQDNKVSIISCIAVARENAQQVREQISSEMWQQLNQLFLQVRRTSKNRVWRTQPHKFFQVVKEGAHLFQGITDSTMSHDEGWRFIQIGRSIERAGATAALLDAHFKDMKSLDYLAWVGLLRSCTAFEAYCKVYTADIHPQCVAEFLLLNNHFPHAVRFSVNQLQFELQAITQATGIAHAGRAERLAGRLCAMLDYGQIDEIMPDMHAYLENIRNLCADIHTAIQQIYIAYPADAVLDL
jgi:uncharacterized alpha-E superfamily protein